MMIKKFTAIIAAITLILCFAGCGGSKDAVKTGGKADVPERTITISFAGDCTLGTDAAFGGGTLPEEVEAQGKNYSYFLKNVKPIFESDDLTVVNFEGTLTTRGQRQDKTFAFKGDPEYVKILTEGSVEACTLANNHSKDYGTESMEDTKKYLDGAKIAWFENLNTKVLDVKGVKVGLIGLYDLDNSAASNLKPAMERVKNGGAEIVLVQIHWGIEGDNYPDESQVKLAHSIIDAGADLVIGHHPHVLQGIERYNGKMIVYSMGNFCFGGNQNPSDKDTMIYRQTFTVGANGLKDSADYEVIPCRISSVSYRNNYQPTPAEGSEKTRIQEKIQKFSDGVGKEKVRFSGESHNASNDAKTEGKSSMIL